MTLPEPNRESVAVVVASHQGEPWLARCLASCRDSEVRARVVLVDNASTDGSVAIARTFDGVEVLPLTRNMGFGVANNLGINRALQWGARWILLLNQDAFIARDTLGTLIELGARHPGLGVVSPMHLREWGGALDARFAEFLAQGSADWVSDGRSGTTRELYRVPFVNAAAWLVRREALERVGGFDPLFFMYGEDTDWCARARRQGWTIGVATGAEVAHVRGGVTGLPRERRPLSVRLNKAFSEQVVRMKRAERGLLREALRAGLDEARAAARVTLEGRPSEAVIRATAFTRTVTKLPIIARHRRQQREAGPHFLHPGGRR